MIRMKTSTLYPILLLCVLCIAACQEKTDSTSTATTPEPALPDAPPAEANSDESTLRVVVLGNSLAAGFGLDPSQAFPALLQQKIDSMGWNASVMNAGVSGETTAGGLRRIDWLLRDRIDVLILELGGNDGLRGVQTEVTKNNLQAIIDQTRGKYPGARVILAGMQVPTNLGQAYTSRFREIFPELAQENSASLIPFLLENVGGIPELNLPDGIHPTAQGHIIVAETVWRYLKPELERLQSLAPTTNAS